MSESTGALIPFEEKAIQRPETPREMIAAATEQAKALSDVIERCKLYSVIGGKKYVRCEGWTTLGRFQGVIPTELTNEPKEDGRYVATVALVRIADGRTLSVASAECGGPDEQMWQNRPPFARRSMAATRATGKACRLAYSWIMALSGAGYELTPAEEMTHLEGQSVRAEPDPFDAPFEKRLEDVKPILTKDEPSTEKAIVTEAALGIIKVEERTSKKGKTYYRIGFKLAKNGHQDWLTTFDTKVADEAKRAMEAGLSAMLTSEMRPDGPVLVDIKLDEPPF